MAVEAPTNTSPASGFLLVFLMVGTFFVAILTAAAAHLVVVGYGTSYAERYRVNTQLAVDAAVSQALTELDSDSTWPGTGGEVTLLDQHNIRTTYTTQVATNSPESKTISVTGNVYRTSSGQLMQTRSVEVGVAEGTTTQPSDNYSVVTGYGGLIMYGSSAIAGGDVYINGVIEMNNSTTIGSSSDTAKVYVANQAGQPGQPITLNNSAHIYGEVRATGQTNGAQMSNPGLIAGEAAPAVPLPDHDRSSITTQVATTQNGATASCAGAEYVVWPADLKIVGNVEVASMCNVTVMGDVWITGNLIVSGLGRVSVADGATQSPTVMIDGSQGFSGEGMGILQPNSNGVGMNIITYYANASCNPGCTAVTGSALANSRNHTTIAINNSFTAPGNEFYARWSKLVINGNPGVGSLAGQTIELNNAGVIQFDGSVTDFTAGSGATVWRMSSYNRVYN